MRVNAFVCLCACACSTCIPFTCLQCAILLLLREALELANDSSDPDLEVETLTYESACVHVCMCA